MLIVYGVMFLGGSIICWTGLSFLILSASLMVCGSVLVWVLGLRCGG